MKRRTRPTPARVTALRALWMLTAAGFALACGSRTGLFAPEGSETTATLPDGAPDRDATIPLDDATVVDALPPIDALPPRDADQTDCPDADATLVYVVTDQNELFSFFPPSGTFKQIGRLVCPAPDGTTPFSMAVDRQGVAYVVFNDGRLYRVSTATAACVSTSFRVGQQGFSTFGMGFATDQAGPTERLFIAGDGRGGAARGLANIDLTNFRVNPIGAFSPPIERAELTGTGDGRLFAFYTKNTGVGSFVGEIDMGTARVLSESPLGQVELGQGWAFSFWGGDFYLFTAPDGPSSRVTRFRPSDGSITVVGSVATTIVGAGVSTCAPAQ